ncbi:hypothetical protein D9M72_415500 [compost metagenome]
MPLKPQCAETDSNLHPTNGVGMFREFSCTAQSDVKHTEDGYLRHLSSPSEGTRYTPVLLGTDFSKDDANRLLSLGL